MEKHTHKYVRVRIGRNKRIEYRCDIPGCVHHVRKELVVGRFSICHKCGQQFVMTKQSTRLAKPYCANCGTKEEVKEILNTGSVMALLEE